MSRYRRLKNLVKRRLCAIPKSPCENCCLEREHNCEVDEYHVIHHYDSVFSRKRSLQKFRLRLLKELLLECVRESDTVILHIVGYETTRPWLQADSSSEINKENMIPQS